MRYLSVYSGIGMHDLGFDAAGWQCVGQIEKDAFCRAVLERHWPGLARWEDVCNVTVESIRRLCGRVDCITGGFACQDISTAGEGAGLGRETRSGLTWRQLVRLVRGVRPDWIVIENVPALRTRGADRVLPVLEALGYACWPLVVGAEHVGAPHRRHRVWIVGKLVDAESDRPHRHRHQRACGTSVRQQAELDGPSQWQGGSAEMADACGSGLEGGREFTSSTQPQVSMPAGRGSAKWPSRPGEQPYEWERPRVVESGVGGPASGHARRLDRFARKHALKAYGNGNPPHVAYSVAEAINRTAAALVAESRLTATDSNQEGNQ